MRVSILCTIHTSFFEVPLVQKALFLHPHFHCYPHFGISIDVLGCRGFTLKVCIRIDSGNSPYVAINYLKIIFVLVTCCWPCTQVVEEVASSLGLQKAWGQGYKRGEIVMLTVSIMALTGGS